MTKETYYARKTAGLCTRCGLVPPCENSLKCETCKDRSRKSQDKFTNEQKREWRKQRLEKDPQRTREVEWGQFSRFYTTTKGRATHMLNNARKRATNQGVTCTLTQEWIKGKLDVGLCEVTGIPFELRINGGKGHRDNPFSPSLDRINQTGNYSPENVRVTCWIHNRARGAFHDEDFERMISALIEKRK